MERRCLQEPPSEIGEPSGQPDPHGPLTQADLLDWLDDEIQTANPNERHMSMPSTLPGSVEKQQPASAEHRWPTTSSYHTVTPTNPMSPREKVHSRSVEERLDEMTSIIQAQDEEIRHMQVLIRLMQAHKSGKSAKEMQKRTRTLIKLASMKKLKAMETPAAIPWGHSATSTPPHGLTPDLGPKSISADVSASLSDDEGEADDAGTVLSWVRGIFDALDAHHSGYLNRDELENARRQLLPVFGEDSEMARLLKRIEDDFQTALSWDEFVAVIHDPDAEISKNRESGVIQTKDKHKKQKLSQDGADPVHRHPAYSSSPLKQGMDRSGTGISSAGSLSREETMALVDQEDLENGQWVSVSQNAYGAFIHVALQSGLLRACSMCLPMVGVSVFVQLVFSIQLLDAHRTDFDDFGDDICRVYYLLHIVSVLIFLIMMLNNIPSMVMAGVITLASTHHKNGDGDAIGEFLQELEMKQPSDEGQEDEEAKPLDASIPARLTILLFAVLTEILTWGLILLSGVIWILTMPSTDMVIRSTVAIMFVLNVDELVFESCCSPKIREDVSETKYCIPSILNDCGMRNLHDHIIHYFGIYVYTPLLVGLSSGTVLLMRFDLADCWER